MKTVVNLEILLSMSTQLTTITNQVFTMFASALIELRSNLKQMHFHYVMTIDHLICWIEVSMIQKFYLVMAASSTNQGINPLEALRLYLDMDVPQQQEFTQVVLLLVYYLIANNATD